MYRHIFFLDFPLGRGYILFAAEVTAYGTTVKILEDKPC